MRLAMFIGVLATLCGPALSQTTSPEMRDLKGSVELLQAIAAELRTAVQNLKDTKPSGASKRSAFLVPSISAPTCGASNAAPCNTRLAALQYCNLLGYAGGTDYDVRSMGAGRFAFGAICYDP